jgi:hypothetical protein
MVLGVAFQRTNGERLFLFDALSFGGRGLEKEIAAIRDPKYGFPWISDSIDPT